MESRFTYYEYKFHVSNENLKYVLSALGSFYRNSDPFDSGIVDSIYFDSLDRKFYHQCLNGEAEKIKYRIRGYGDGTFHQLHEKRKNLYEVIKRKAKIQPVRCGAGLAPLWDDLKPANESDSTFSHIQASSSRFGTLSPAIRVRYKRNRFRINDYRLTLDYQIEVQSFVNGLPSIVDYHVLPYHVLEIKTVDPRPVLPLLGLMKLPQISFSKYFLGINFLVSGEEMLA